MIDYAGREDEMLQIALIELVSLGQESSWCSQYSDSSGQHPTFKEREMRGLRAKKIAKTAASNSYPTKYRTSNTGQIYTVGFKHNYRRMKKLWKQKGTLQ